MWWLVLPVVVVTLEPVLAELVACLRERQAARRRARVATDEWIVVLDGDDIGLLSGSVVTDMFWKQFLVIGDDARLFDETLWLQCRFRFRHASSGHYAPHAFCGGLRPTRDDRRVAMRGLY